MPIRDVVEIDEELCDGCGDCVPSCAEGAIQIIDGKARLVSDVYCDGLGACLGICPTGAITVKKREAEAFDEAAVADHLSSLADDAEPAAGVALPMVAGQAPAPSCPGSKAAAWDGPAIGKNADAQAVSSGLRQWPIQLHLLPPTAPFLADADLLVAADCAAYSVGGFHRRFLDGRALAIACPKLDSHQEIYVEKLATMIDQAGLRQLTVMVMEVPCCNGLVGLVREAQSRAGRQIPATAMVVGVRGEVLATRPL
jgi:NAD-dependent dihydropyrimidine dehydrogenase PreA subunit